jgi:hypothetical protein
MKILRPVPVSKRLPLAGELVFVSTKSGLTDIAEYYSDVNDWVDSYKVPLLSNSVVSWFEEVEIESLFPDEETGYKAAENASNKQIQKSFMHMEGQTYFKNYLLKQLQK